MIFPFSHGLARPRSYFRPSGRPTSDRHEPRPQIVQGRYHGDLNRFALDTARIPSALSSLARYRPGGLRTSYREGCTHETPIPAGECAHIGAEVNAIEFNAVLDYGREGDARCRLAKQEAIVAACGGTGPLGACRRQGLCRFGAGRRAPVAGPSRRPVWHGPDDLFSSQVAR